MASISAGLELGLASYESGLGFRFFHLGFLRFRAVRVS